MAREIVSETGAIRANRDDLRVMLFGDKKTFNTDREDKVTLVQQAIVKEALAAGKDVIVDDTNLRPKYMTAWQKIANDLDAELEVIEINIPVEEAIRRQEFRPVDDQVEEGVIRTMERKFIPKGKFLPWDENPTDKDPVTEPYVPDPELPPAIICDLDGTLATMGDRGPYEFHRVGEDTVNEAVKSVLESMAEDHQIIFLSGREDSCSKETMEWLLSNLSDKVIGVSHGPFMRKTKDYRKDSIVKYELFEAHVRGKFDVRLALDDRDQVVKLWRSMGIPTFQVNYGNF